MAASIKRVPFRTRTLLGSSLLLLSASVAAQSGGPIGGPVGAPTGANGSNGGSYYQGSRGALSAPSTNWSSGRAGRGSYGMDRRNQSINSYRTPQVTNFQSQQGRRQKQIPGQPQPSGALQKKVRPGQDDQFNGFDNFGGKATRTAGSRARRGTEETINLEGLTRKVARKEVNAVEHYRDIVQQGMLAEAGFTGSAKVVL